MKGKVGGGEGDQSAAEKRSMMGTREMAGWGQKKRCIGRCGCCPSTASALAEPLQGARTSGGRWFKVWGKERDPESEDPPAKLLPLQGASSVSTRDLAIVLGDGDLEKERDREGPAPPQSSLRSDLSRSKRLWGKDSSQAQGTPMNHFLITS